MSKVKRKNRALLWVLVIACAPMAIFLFFFIVGMIVGSQTTETTVDATKVQAEESPVKDDFTPLAEEYKSATPFEILYKVDNSRYYYVQQTDGEVTNQSVDEIIKELYAKEAWSENSGLLGNVIVYGKEHNLKSGERPSPDLIESAEYQSRDKIIVVGGKETIFEPARKK